MIEYIDSKESHCKECNSNSWQRVEAKNTTNTSYEENDALNKYKMYLKCCKCGRIICIDTD